MFVGTSTILPAKKRPIRRDMSRSASIAPEGPVKSAGTYPRRSAPQARNREENGHGRKPHDIGAQVPRIGCFPNRIAFRVRSLHADRFPRLRRSLASESGGPRSVAGRRSVLSRFFARRAFLAALSGPQVAVLCDL